MRILVTVMIACLMAPAAAAETALWFVGDGTDTVIVRPSPSTAITAPSNHPMSLEGHGASEATHLTVLGNSVDRNPFLPTFIWSGMPLTLQEEDVITVHHYAAVTGGAAGPAACGLIGTLYDEGGTVIKQHTVLGGGVDYREFVFTFTGLSGEFPVLRFQAVQNSNQCGWATIEHIWGSDAYPARMIVPDRALFGEPDAAAEAQTVFQDLADPSGSLSFANATNDTYVLNFTTDLVNSTLAFTWNATAGAVNATLADANGTLVFEGAVDGNGSVQHAIAGATAGAWNLTLSFTGFVGDVGFQLLEVEAPDEEPPQVEPDQGPTDDNETAELDGTDGEDTPLPWVLPAAGLLAAAARRRRGAR